MERGWLLMALGKALWADCRTRSAFTDRDGLILVARKMAARETVA